jgi:putative flavoprotein involved in K+ transport
MNENNNLGPRNENVVIIGAGPAGIGLSIIFRKMRLKHIVLEKESIGASFKKWPKEMRMISPSFTGNFFLMVDLNAISPDSSPAYTLQTEHPNGQEYAEYLETLADHYKLPIELNKALISIKSGVNGYILKTEDEEIFAKYVIWAAGEFQFPLKDPFPGAHHCIHTATIPTWKDLSGDEFLIIGAAESGIDTAVQLSKLNKKVHVIDSNNSLENFQSDSSYSLSPYTRDRYNEYKENIHVTPDTRVVEVVNKEDNYIIISEDGKEFTSNTKPILAVGFKSSLSKIQKFFEYEDGIIRLSDQDESTLKENFFLIGPQVRHDDAIFCFIYKFRQRFAIVAEEIAKRLMHKKELIKQVIDEYKQYNFYLEDLSCCSNSCAC